MVCVNALAQLHLRSRALGGVHGFQCIQGIAMAVMLSIKTKGARIQKTQNGLRVGPAIIRPRGQRFGQVNSLLHHR